MDFIYLYETYKKPLAIALSGAGRGLKGRWWGYLTDLHYKTDWNCHNESFLHNEHVLIKN
jgi:hypothetical protein